MQKLILISRVGGDAEIRQVGNTNVVNFSVCHSESYKDTQGVKKEKSLWFAASYFTDKTTIAQYIKRGDNIYLEGQVDARMYDDRNGKPQIQMTIRVTNIQLLGNSNNQSQGSSEQNFKDKLGDKPTQFQDDSAPF